MPRPRNEFPKPRQHKGRAVLDIYEGGKRRCVTLGPWGSELARQEYARLLAENEAGGRCASPDITVNEVFAAFLKWADTYYVRADGTSTHEVVEYEIVSKCMRKLYGHTLAREVGPLALKATRQKMIAAGWCRTLVNRRVGRVRRVFSWAASEEMIPFEVYQALTTVEGLKRGRGVRESKPVKPVAAEHVSAILPYVRPEVKAMVEVQLLSGMRPGEVCRLRPCDTDMSGPVWVYSPTQHKNSHRGKAKAIAIGPRAQAVLLPFTPTDPSDYYFSPSRAVAALHAARTTSRKTPRFPSHMRRNAEKRIPVKKRPPAARYSTKSYGQAIDRGVDRANKARAGEVPIPRFAPNMLRHAAATAVRKRYGLEAAGATLGHEQLNTTEIYAEKNLELAARIALEVG